MRTPEEVDDDDPNISGLSTYFLSFSPGYSSFILFFFSLSPPTPLESNQINNLFDHEPKTLPLFLLLKKKKKKNAKIDLMAKAAILLSRTICLANTT